MIVVMIVCKCTSMRCCSGIDRETQPRACSHSDNWSVESILRMETCCQPLDVEMSRNFSTVIVGCWNSGIVPSNIGIGIVKNVHAISFLYRRWNLKGTGHLQKHTKTIWKNRRFNFRRVVCPHCGATTWNEFQILHGGCWTGASGIDCWSWECICRKMASQLQCKFMHRTFRPRGNLSGEFRKCLYGETLWKLCLHRFSIGFWEFVGHSLS